MILGTAGHVDHGKTSLVKALTGVDTDRLPEEKKRGITIDLGFAPLELEGVGTVGVVDVPGHENFVRTMLAGASGINLGLLVVAADEGVMPQTREHLEILRLLDVSVPIVALTKADLADEEWRSLILADVRQLFTEQVRVEPAIIPVSVLTGEGVESLRKSLSVAFAAQSVPTGPDLFRMPVDRVFSIKGTGTVVSGTIWSGEVTPGDCLNLLPSDLEARVRRVESHGKIVERCATGTRCAIAISNLSLDQIARGDVLTGGAAWHATSRIAARVSVEQNVYGALKKGRTCTLHIGTSSVSGRLRFPLGEDGRDDAYAIIDMKAPVVARAGDRFVLRSASPVATIGGGVVLDPFPARGSIRQRIASEPGPEKLRQLLALAGVRGISAQDLSIRTGLSPVRARALSEKTRDVLEFEGILFSESVAATLETRIMSLLDRSEVNDPLTNGVSLSTVRMVTRAAELFDLVVRRMRDRGALVVEDGLVRRASWSPKLDEAVQSLSDSVSHDICASGREPPSVDELVRKRGNKVHDLLRLLEKKGSLVQVETGRYYDAVVVKELIGELRGRMTGGRVYSPAELREILGFSRKYLIPFLEYCDRMGVTERRSEGRVLRP